MSAPVCRQYIFFDWRKINKNDIKFQITNIEKGSWINNVDDLLLYFDYYNENSENLIDQYKSTIYQLINDEIGWNNFIKSSIGKKEIEGIKKKYK